MLARVTSSMGAHAPIPPLHPVPRRSLRPWAGRRLGGEGEGVGELWLAGPDSVVDAGPWGRLTLDELAAQAGEPLIGSRGMRLLGPRFPLLVKVIDAAEWLSLQVHPDDALAAELYGAGQLGKEEAWLVLDAEPGAHLVTGPRRDLTAEQLRAAIRDGVVGREHCDERVAVPGETLLLEPGTMHAIGAGTFVYEIEQPSDLTFRMSDWGRPATPERPLHVAESLRAVRAEAHARPVGRDWRLDGGALETPSFRLEIARLERHLDRAPGGEGVEVLTIVAGGAVVSGDGFAMALEPYDTLVLPASLPGYRIGLSGGDAVTACIGSLPGGG
jgi:mannose-6-phosphate isomerase